MSGPAATLSSPAAHRDRSPEGRQAARAKKAERERRIVNLINHGVSFAAIAEREGLSYSRARALVREILARRQPRPPAEFIAAEVARLNAELFVVYGSMRDDRSGANLDAVGRVAKIVRALDLYHGFSPSRARRPSATRP